MNGDVIDIYERADLLRDEAEAEFHCAACGAAAPRINYKPFPHCDSCRPDLFSWGPKVCHATGHVDGCQGNAYGEHVLQAGWIEYEQDGFTIEVEVIR